MWQYTPEQMAQAIREVQLGSHVATAAKKYGVPRITLYYKVSGKCPLNVERKIGRRAVLTEEEEKIIVEWIKATANAGFPVTASQVQESVKELVKKLGRENTFQEGRPGRKWLAGFLKRNPTISIRTAENLTISRANITKDRLLQWFSEVEDFLRNKGFLEILNDSQRVFNGDETAFFLNPKGTKVLAGKGEKSVHLQVNSDEKECLTVLITASAAGTLAPPLIIFKYERVPRHVGDSVPVGWGIGRSDSGWMTSATFYEYIANVFYPWLVTNSITLPVILFLDGHVSHLTLNLSDLCQEKGIILIALPPNATHIMQPMDVSVFRALKESWKIKVHEWRMQHMDNPVLKKQHFPGLLNQVLQEKITPSIVGNGFRKCGLVPWNSQAITLKETQNPLICKSSNKDILLKYQHCLTLVEDFIGKEKALTFSSTSIWTGDVKDTSMYNFWREVKTKIDTLQNLQCQTNSADNLKDCCKDNSFVDENINHSVSTCAEAHVFSSQVIENSINTNSALPSLFKTSLIWPSVKLSQEKSKKFQRERITSVITSDKFRDYQEKKKN